MTTENHETSQANRHKARECALQILFAADMYAMPPAEQIETYWRELGDEALDAATRDFATKLAGGSLEHRDAIDERIRSRAEHWRIERMAIVDRNVLRLAVFEFVHMDTPNTVVINEALEIARRFSTFEATQFINGILDAIRQDIEGTSSGKTHATSNQ
ncbi:MAG: transcription antitermination factor NusB [Acidobacteria bacterium OLB17]|nr:MAG: transcription antitermination factor NusB [Acidobacteria bacterium OLB17]MCZ2391054.1 transcription antitermination factor NusB [Acidobacteriota bacterium]